MNNDLVLDKNFIKKEFSVTSILPTLFMLPNIMEKDFGSNGLLWSLAYD
jgi:hypothetical protein